MLSATRTGLASLVVLLAGCSYPEYAASLEWHDEDHVRRMLQEAECPPFDLLGRPMAAQRLERVEHRFAAASWVAAYAAPVDVPFAPGTWMELTFPEGEGAGAWDAVAEVFEHLSQASPQRTEELLATMRNNTYGIATDAEPGETSTHVVVHFLDADPGWQWGPWFHGTFGQPSVADHYSHGPWTAYAHVASCTVADFHIAESGVVTFTLTDAESQPSEQEVRQAARAALAAYGLQVPPDATFRAGGPWTNGYARG